MRVFLALCLMMGFSVPAHADNIPGTAIVLRALDKVTATTQDYTVKVGDTLKYGSLSIDAVHCENGRQKNCPKHSLFLKSKTRN